MLRALRRASRGVQDEEHDGGDHRVDEDTPFVDPELHLTRLSRPGQSSDTTLSARPTSIAPTGTGEHANRRRSRSSDGARASDSVISLSSSISSSNAPAAASSDIDASLGDVGSVVISGVEHDEDDRLSDGSSSDGTALASRTRYDGAASPPTGSLGVARLREDEGEGEDMATPGVHTEGSHFHLGTTPTPTATLSAFIPGQSVNSSASIHQDGQAQAEEDHDNDEAPSPRHTAYSQDHQRPTPAVRHLTLSSYLASTLSSPKTRSQSSSSLASFPTDLLSDISRQDAASIAESHVDGQETDEEGASSSGFNSDPASDGADSASRFRGCRSRLAADERSSALVMPTLSASQSHQSRRSHGPGRQQYSDMPVNSARGDSARDTFDTTVCFDAAETPMRVLVVAQSQDHYKRISALLRENATVVPSLDHVPSISAAVQRVHQPLRDLASVLRPDGLQAGGLFRALLPDLLEKAGVFDVVLWHKNWDEEDLDRGTGTALASLRRFLPVVPISLDAAAVAVAQANEASRTASSALVTDAEHILTSLSSSNSRPDADLLAQLRHARLRSRSIKAFVDYQHTLAAARQKEESMSPARHEAEHPSTMPMGAWGSTAASESSHHADLGSQDPSSLASSLVDSLTLPPTSQESLEHPYLDRSTSYSKRVRMSSKSASPLYCRKYGAGHALDPLHLPSLVQLLGLSLVDKFTRFKSAVANFVWAFMPGSNADDTSDASEDAADQGPPKVKEDQAAKQAAAQHLRALSPSCRPFFGCGHRGGGGDGVPDPDGWRNHRAFRCKGLFVMSVLVGVALFYS